MQPRDRHRSDRFRPKFSPARFSSFHLSSVCFPPPLPCPLHSFIHLHPSPSSCLLLVSPSISSRSGLSPPLLARCAFPLPSRYLGRYNLANCSNGSQASKVAVLGASGGIGQPLSLLMKLNPRVTNLALYDIRGGPGMLMVTW